MQDLEYDVLEQYDVKVRSTRKVRGAILCDTEQGIYLLKEAKVPPERIAALAEMYEHLEKQEWCKVDAIIKNQNGEFVSEAGNGIRYVLKKWYTGRECDVKKPGEVLEATGMLAKLHTTIQQKIESPVSKAVPIQEEYQKHNRELRKVRNHMRKISPKSEFEYEFLRCYDEMFQWAEASAIMLQESAYEELYKESIANNCMVHGEYNYHNVLMAPGEGKADLIAVTNFEKIKQDIQVEDFYYLLRKVMEKYGWKERLGDSMINAYSAVKPLSEKETEYIKIRLAYPEKFWKTANAYYQSNKAWVSAKNIEKLGTAIRQTKEKERFLGNLFGLNF